MIQANLENRYDTHYHLELKDAGTGKVKQTADTKNVFLMNWWNSNAQVNPWRLVNGIQLGSGTGTASESDGGLFRALFYMGSSSETVSMDVENKTITFVSKATFPATSAYVGTITEIGIFSRVAYPNSRDTGDGTIFTHALLKDAEGNPLAIVKEDTDILEVTVSITLSYSAEEPWKISKFPGMMLFEKCADIGWGHTAFNNQWCNVNLALGTTDSELRSVTKVGVNSYRDRMEVYVKNASFHVLAGGSMNKAQKKMTFGNVRIAQGVGASRPIYYNYVLFTGFCYASLPNAELFPTYQISNIALGTGDGTTMKFENPLNYFVKDSEKVYVNGSLKVRDMDYTIDYRHNAGRLPELAATKNAVLSGGVVIGAGTSNGHRQLLFQRMLANVGGYLLEPASVGWKVDAPLIIELEEARDVNTFYLPAWVAAGTVTLYSSNDGEEWTKVLEVERPSKVADLRTFTLVNAKYWKIEGENTSWATHENTTDDMAQELFLGYTGYPYIIFTNPPEEGAVITMDVDMDRPFKNGNFVIDASAELQLS